MKPSRPTPSRWSDYVSLKPRYQRSVHLERDASEPTWLDGYVISPAVQTLATRIVTGLARSSGPRAWSVTGPYGSGKSAFALFASHLLGLPGASETRAARAALRKAAPAVADALFERRDEGLVAVRATGERRPLDAVLLHALSRSAQQFWSGRGAKPSVFQDLARAIDRQQRGRRVTTREVVSLFEEVAEKVATSNQSGRGLFVVLDEAGKVLEHASHAPAEGDMHLLQELAEAATRSGGTPIVFAVVLHQAFEQYASRLGSTNRNEWAKVHGRFEDVAFQEASDQVIRLIGAALQTSALPRAWSKQIDLAAAATAAAAQLPAERSEQIAESLNAVAPLHPTTALVLGPLFRTSLGQNERSLFAFLGSADAGGFQEMLAQRISSDAPAPLFTLDALYDYVRHSLGPRIHGAQAHHWAQAETALARLAANASGVEARVLKTVAILGSVGEQAGMRPSDSVIRAAFAGTEVDDAAVDEALRQLKLRSLIVYRRYRDAYQLWDGSDLDIESLIAAGLSQGPTAGLPKRLAKLAPPRAIVPRRHAVLTGTLRYLEVRYADESVLDAPFMPSVDADATVYLLIPTDDRAAADAKVRLAQSLYWMTQTADARARPTLLAVPRDASRLRHLGLELTAMEWVQTSTAELRDDPVARKELTTRIAEAERVLRNELRALTCGESACDWYFRGETFTVSSPRELSMQLSEVLDAAYAAAPRVHNELINRSDLSSAAASARRELMTRMIERSADARLGIEGFPPEYSIYRSVLEVQGIHRDRGGELMFSAPVKSRRGSFTAAWNEIVKTITASGRTRVALNDVYERLRRPPFGVRDGVLPILVLAVLLEREQEIALFEDGVFVPGITSPVAERMLRASARFEIQRYPIGGARAELLLQLTKATDGSTSESPALLPIVKQVVRLVANLPEYSKNTRRLSAAALAVREGLLRAKEPGPLLFDTLPQACGLPPFAADAKADATSITKFVETLKAALREISGAYPKLQRDIASNVGHAFGVPTDVRELRASLAPRAAAVMGIPVDASLKSFLMRLSDADLGDDEWIVSVATLLGGKPPESWSDSDFDQAMIKLAMLRRSFQTVEALHVASTHEPLADDGFLLRVAIAQPGRAEAERVVSIRPDQVTLVQEVAKSVRRKVLSDGKGVSRDILVAALAVAAREIMNEEQPAAITPKAMETPS